MKPKSNLEIFAPAILLNLAVLLLLLGVAWWEGTMKARYVYYTQGINMPWYQAVFLDVKAGELKVNQE